MTQMSGEEGQLSGESSYLVRFPALQTKDDWENLPYLEERETERDRQTDRDTHARATSLSLLSIGKNPHQA